MWDQCSRAARSCEFKPLVKRVCADKLRHLSQLHRRSTNSDEYRDHGARILKPESLVSRSATHSACSLLRLGRCMRLARANTVSSVTGGLVSLSSASPLAMYSVLTEQASDC